MIKALDERPEIESGTEWIWQAFNRLSTTRSNGFGQGPISYLALTTYAADLELSEGEREYLWDCLKKLDTMYLELVKPKK